MKSNSQKKSRSKKSSGSVRIPNESVTRMLQLVAEKNNRTHRHGVADSLILAKNSKRYKPSGAGTFNRPK
jgi:hypothetical protein